MIPPSIASVCPHVQMDLKLSEQALEQLAEDQLRQQEIESERESTFLKQQEKDQEVVVTADQGAHHVAEEQQSAAASSSAPAPAPTQPAEERKHSLNAKPLFSRVLPHTACALEWVPTGGIEGVEGDVFVCGEYELDQQQQMRKGRLSVHEVRWTNEER